MKRLCLILACLLGLLGGPARADAPQGDSVAPASLDVTLYYPSGDETDLRPVEGQIVVEPGRSPAECAVMALLGEPGADDVRRLTPEGTRLTAIHEADGAVVVNLSLDARNVPGVRSLYLMREGIARTLLGLKGVTAVDVLVAGAALPVFSLPMGCCLDAAEPAEARFERLGSDGGDGRYVRDGVIYYPARDGRWAVPRARRVTVDGDPIGALFQALCDGGGAGPLAGGLAGLTLKDGAVTVRPDGRRVARLDLQAEDRPADADLAALCLTVCGFLPGLDGVALYLGSEPVASFAGTALDGGLMTYAMAEPMVADVARAYLTDGEGRLRASARAMYHAERCMPRLCLKGMFVSDPEAGLVSAAPEGVTVDDIRAVHVADGVMTVSLGETFYAACQAMRPAQEKALVYALVSTGTEFYGVNAVRLLIEGEPAATLASSVSIEGNLTRVPGLIAPDK